MTADEALRDGDLFCTLMDWWWYDRLDADDEPIRPPNAEDQAAVRADLVSLVDHLYADGFVLVRIHASDGTLRRALGDDR